MRKYTTGSRWAFWRWTDIGHIKRLFLTKTPWFSICLHWLVAADPEPFMHDHPATFLSLVLRGGYREVRRGVRGSVWRMWFNVITASFFDRHRIVEVLPGTVTLCFMGPGNRVWGYHTPRGWIPWTEYERLQDDEAHA